MADGTGKKRELWQTVLVVGCGLFICLALLLVAMLVVGAVLLLAAPITSP